jgi:hypothetical protein
MTVVLWGVTAILPFGIVEPYVSLDNGRTLVFDPLALVEATSIMTCLAILSWIPVFAFAQRRPKLLSAGLVIVLTWICLGVPFWLIDGSGFFNVGTFRATRVMGNGQDMAFLPLVIPATSLFSGAAYSMAMWLSIQSRRVIRNGSSKAS